MCPLRLGSLSILSTCSPGVTHKIYCPNSSPMANQPPMAHSYPCLFLPPLPCPIFGNVRRRCDPPFQTTVYTRQVMHCRSLVL
ncbi:hypothetical protein BDZ91DRAFT_709083, partial [Kalaharituber pfeilii]